MSITKYDLVWHEAFGTHTIGEDPDGNYLCAGEMMGKLVGLYHAVNEGGDALELIIQLLREVE